MPSRARSTVRELMLVVIVLSFGWLLPAAAEDTPSSKKPLAIDDLYRLDTPQAVRLSPDGAQAVYVRQWIEAGSKRERQALWLVPGRRDQARPLEPDQPEARTPVFSPDGKWIAFLSTRPRPEGWKQTPPVPAASDPAADIWLMPGAGGPSIPLAGPDKPYGRVFHDSFYGRVAFAPDGRRLVFVADDGKDPRTPQEIAADVIVDRPDQGEGYTGYGPAQVWIAHLDGSPGKFAALRIERLTHDDVWYGDPQWSPDGRFVVVHANKTADRESVRFSINKNYDLWAIDVQTRAVRQLTSGPGPEISPRFAPDGKRLACLSIPRKGSHMDVFNLALITLGESGSAVQVLFDHHGPDGQHPLHPLPTFPLPDECWDENNHLIYNAALGTTTATVRVDVHNGKKTPLEDPKPGSNSAVSRLQRRQVLTPPGNLFLQERILGEARMVNWKNAEGQTIEGIFTTPPAALARPPYKLVLHPHGGPHSRSAQGFDFTVQTFAAQGYAVFQPNFRGSGGYGQKFIDADRFDFGGGDMRDILSGIDFLVGQGLVDRDRQFVYGVSYGGFMTCWLVGQTTQFRAAVAQNAVTDLEVMWGLSDLQSWTVWEFGGRPWEVPGAMRRHSPLTYVANVRTPTLVLHSRDDRRCPLPMGRMYYQALHTRGVPTQLVIYPDEGHGIRQPRHREDVLRRTLAWFEQYDKK